MSEFSDLGFSLDSALSRRTFLRRAAALGVGLSAGPALFADEARAAGPTGTAVLNNYPGWIGSHELAAFSKKYPGAKIKQVTNATSSTAEVVLQFRSGQYDMLLADTSDCAQASAAGFVEKLDWSRIPNIANVSPKFRKAYPWGIPTDYGKVGIGYRPDIVGERIRSWHDVWRLAPKLSGQIVFIDLERDCLGSTLKYLGHSCNTTNPAHLKAAKDALVKIKPHLKAFLNTDVTKGLVNGSTAIAMGWDYDVAVNKQKQPKIEWVAPQEGMHAYLEGFTATKRTKHLDVVQAFMNFALNPRQYADFVNTTGTAYAMPKATPYIKKSISKNPILLPGAAVLKRTEFDRYLGGKGAALWATTWQEVKAA